MIDEITLKKVIGPLIEDGETFDKEGEGVAYQAFEINSKTTTTHVFEGDLIELRGTFIVITQDQGADQNKNIIINADHIEKIEVND